MPSSHRSTGLWAPGPQRARKHLSGAPSSHGGRGGLRWLPARRAGQALREPREAAPGGGRTPRSFGLFWGGVEGASRFGGGEAGAGLLRAMAYRKPLPNPERQWPQQIKMPSRRFLQCRNSRCSTVLTSRKHHKCPRPQTVGPLYVIRT